jgi:hypothetical protein
MNVVTNEASGFQQTQSTRVKDPGPAQDANPPPPPKTAAQAQPVPANDDSKSPHPYRGHNLNTTA